MKFLRLTVLLMSLCGLALFSSCGGGGGEDAPVEKTQLKLLSKTWKISKATFGNTDGNQTTTYTGMTLTISGTFNATAGTSYDYSVAGLPTGTGVKTPWPRASSSATTIDNASWRFSETEPATVIFREDPDGDLSVTYFVTKDKLELSFYFMGAGYRTSAVEGQWKFEFTPQ